MYLTGIEYLQRNDLIQALQSLRSALLCDNRDYRVWIGLGDIYSLKKDYEKALVHYLHSLSLFPQCSISYCRLVQTWLQLNQLSHAQSLLNKGLSIHKENPGVSLL